MMVDEGIRCLDAMMDKARHGARQVGYQERERVWRSRHTCT